MSSLVRPVLLPALALLMAVVLAACGGAQARYAAHMARGKHYMEQGKLDKASVEFRNALQIEPKAADALFATGQVAERLGDLRGAFGAYEAVLGVQPDFVPAQVSIASYYVMAGLPDRALKFIEPELAKHPDSAALLVLRGAARLALKDPAGARKDAERTLQLDPGNARAVGLLAGLDRAAGDIPAAIALTGDAVRHAPQSVELRELFVSLYFDSGKTEEGRAQLRKLIELQPQVLRYREELALSLVREHQTDSAQHVLEEAVRAMPDSDQAKLSLADFISSQRSSAEGEKTLRDFIARAPDDYALRLGLGALQTQRGATAEALSTYAEVAHLDGDRPDGLTALDRMASIETARGDREAAGKLVSEILRANPADTEALSLRGLMEAEQNNALAAITDLRAVLREHPEATPVRLTLARVYIANGQVSLAEEALRQAMETSPSDVGPRVELAALLAGTRRPDEAVSLLEASQKLAPNDVSLREALVRAYLAKGDLATARRTAEDIETLRPKSPNGYYLAGLVAQADKRLEDGERDFQRALDLQPKALDALIALARVKVARGHVDQAIALVQTASGNEPGNPLPLNLLADLYGQAGDRAHAEQTLDRVIGLAPHWALPYRELAQLRLRANDRAGALSAYELGVKGVPGDLQLGTELAALYERQGRFDDAIARLEDLHRLYPNQSGIASGLAMLLVTYRTDQRSLDLARDLTASFTSSDDPNLLDSCGWATFKRGDYAEALPILERAARRSPDSKEILYHVAMAELRAGQRDRARTNLESALSGSAAFVGAEDARSVLASLKSSAG